VCDELGISVGQFCRWRDELALLSKDAFPGTGVSRDQELSALKHELAQVKAADITYISTRQGWLCLAVDMDPYSRRIVGWSMSR